MPRGQVALLVLGAVLYGGLARAQCDIGEEAVLTAPDARAHQQFGTSVALDGDRAVVGIPGDDQVGPESGAVDVFERSLGRWAHVQRLRASDAAARSSFGASVDLQGDTMVVGSPRRDLRGPRSGAVYVFERQGASWVEVQVLEPADLAEEDRFGESVAVDGDRIVVGSPREDEAGRRAGALYTFLRVSGAWSEEQKILASDSSDGDWLGSSASLSGDWIVAGRPNRRVDGEFRAGLASLFRWDGTSWIHTQDLQASFPSERANFGAAVDLEASALVVGCPYGQGPGTPGQVSCYELVGGTWESRGTRSAANSSPDDQLGRSVSVSGDRVVAGAPGALAFGSRDGAFVLFRRLGSALLEFGRIPGSGGADSLFGAAVACDGVRALAGAPDDSGLATSSGLVQVLTLPKDDLARQVLTPSDVLKGEYFGQRVVADGDTMIAACFAHVSGGRTTGAAYSYRRVQGQWGLEQKLLPADPTMAWFGASIDLEADRVLVGAPRSQGLSREAGAAYVLERSSSTWQQPQKLFASDGVTSDNFGGGVALFGDTALIGAEFHPDSRGIHLGAAYVFRREGGTWLERAKIVGEPVGEYGDFARGVRLGADLAVISALRLSDKKGVVLLYEFDGADWKLLQIIDTPPGVAKRTFGQSMRLEGDLLVIGAPRASVDGVEEAGLVFVHRRQPDGSWAEEAVLRLPSPVVEDLFGSGIVIAGETLVIGSKFASRRLVPVTAHTFQRRAEGWTRIRSQAAGPTAGGRMSLALTGTDLLMGLSTPLERSPGRVEVHHHFDLHLDVEPDQVLPGDRFTATTDFAAPGALALLFAISIDGTPSLTPIARGRVDTLCSFEFTAPVPPGLSGIEIELQSYAWTSFGLPGTSPPRVLKFL